MTMALSTAVEQVNPLNIPEIVAIVVKHLDGKWKPLVACAQVNSLWNQESTAIIWSQELWQDGWPSLASMPTCRAQKYTKSIRYVDDEYFGRTTTCFHWMFSSLHFPKLHRAAFRIPKHSDETHRMQYLVPSLRELRINEYPRWHERHNCVVKTDIPYLSDEFFAHIWVYMSPLSNAFTKLQMMEH